MQAKDIPDRGILRLLAERPDSRDRMEFPDEPSLYRPWANWYSTDNDWNDYSVRPAFPPDCPEALILAKMRKLIKRGLVDGCGCGCRGDFVITPEGEKWLEENK